MFSKVFTIMANKTNNKKPQKVNQETFPPSVPESIPKLVMVVWEDAKEIGDGPWIENKAHAYEPAYFWQVGFLIGDYPEGIQLTEAWGKDLISRSTQIPRGMIVEIKELNFSS